MVQNYILLETIELTQSAASVTFDNIPQTGYTDLKVVISARGDGASGSFMCQFNGATTNLSSRVLYGINGNATGSSTYSDENSIWGYTTNSTSTANTFGNAEIYIPNYLSGNNKSVSIDAVNETNAADGRQILVAGLWASASAITSITLLSKTGGNVGTNFVANSTFSLYGVADVNTTPVTGPLATGGNIVGNDGTYWYHAFLSSGTFTPLQALTPDYLVVAGGAGGGAAGSGAGGGAGGLRSTVTATGGGGSLPSALSLIADTSYTITVGAGGVGIFGSAGTNGSVSSISGGVISTVSTTGGGAGAGGNSGNGGTGGSGGGGSATGAGGARTANEGFAGGDGGGGLMYSGGGGGGAGAVGTAGTNASGNGGNGGNGVQITAFATTTSTGANSGYYAGGGGGGHFNNTAGTGGLGGGGGGSVGSADPTTGTANTGGGGGGRGAGGNAGANGGSGIVIIRYAMA